MDTPICPTCSSVLRKTGCVNEWHTKYSTGDKPKNFKEAALSHIPLSIVESMKRAATVSTDGMTSLEAIAKNTGTQLLPQKVDAPVKPKYISLAVDGHVIKVALDPTEGAVTMLLYLLATVFSKDKKVAKVLKQFNFHFFDENNIQLYPKAKKRAGK